MRLAIIFVLAWPMILYSETSLYLYRPFAGSDHHPKPTLLKTLLGQCLEQSHATKRNDSWRCHVDRAVYDPCFVKRFGSQKEAICAESPWSEKGIKIKINSLLTKSKSTNLDMSRHYPWAIELEDGTRCLAFDSNKMIEGLPVHYQCNNGSLLIGPVRRCKIKWTTLQFHTNQVFLQEIAVAWF